MNLIFHKLFMILECQSWRFKITSRIIFADQSSRVRVKNFCVRCIGIFIPTDSLA